MRSWTGEPEATMRTALEDEPEAPFEPWKVFPSITTLVTKPCAATWLARARMETVAVEVNRIVIVKGVGEIVVLCGSGQLESLYTEGKRACQESGRDGEEGKMAVRKK